MSEAGPSNKPNNIQFLCDIEKPKRSGGGFCKKNARYLCLLCNAVCEECASNRKLHNNGGDHALAEISSFVVEEPTINRETETFKLDNEENTFIELNYMTDDFNSMKLGKKFGEIEHDDSMISDDKHNGIQICSWVGPSGCGKSRLSRMVCDPKSDCPIPGDPQISISTSLDIHAYNGLIEPNFRFIVADCEGSGGTPLIPDFVDEDKKEICGDSKKLCTRKYYPRLLYLFSDVVVYVFKGSRKNRSSILTPLMVYAASSTAYSVNNPFKPFVIIVYNIITRDEAENNWKIHKAQKDLRKQLKSHYRDPKEIFIPDQSLHPLRWFYAVRELKNGIGHLLQEAARIKTDKKLWLSKSDLFKQIAEVTKKLATKTDAEINFVDFQFIENPREIYERIYNLFLLMYIEIKRKVKFQRDAFYDALDLASKCIVFSLRNETNAEFNNLDPQKLEFLLNESAKLIVQLIPCSATREFPLKHNSSEGVELVECEAIMKSHYQHSSLKTYTPIVDESIFGNRYGPISPCQWPFPGEKESSDYTPTPGLSVNSIKGYLGDKCEEYKERKLDSLFYDINQNLPKSKKRDICLSCLGNEYPTVVLGCEHLICKTCCDKHKSPILAQKSESQKFSEQLQASSSSSSTHKGKQPASILEPSPDENEIMRSILHSQRTHHSEQFKIICRFCNSESIHSLDIPKNAGYRILSLDGGGVRGGVLLEVMFSIQEKTGYQIVELFDLIIGTSIGGIIALSLVSPVKPQTIENLCEKFLELSKNIFHTKITETPKMFQSVVYGYRYDRKHLEKHVGELLGEKSILRPSCTTSENPIKMPKVAITSLSVVKGKIEPVLFTSYNFPKGKGRGGKDVIVSMDFTSVALATSAAPAYFKVFEHKEHGSFIDGGLMLNNPCEAGLKEAKALWGEQTVCDILVSLGTGGSKDNIPKFKNSLLNLLKNLADIATDRERTFKDLPLDDNRKFRIEPMLKKDFELDNAKMVGEIQQQAKDFLNSDEGREQVDQLAKHLLTSLLYIEIDNIVSNNNNENHSLLRAFLCSRLPVRKPLKDLIERNTLMVEIKLEVSHQSVFSSLIKVDNNSVIIDQYLRFPFDLPNLSPSRPQTFLVDVFIPKKSKVAYSISGCPFKI